MNRKKISKMKKIYTLLILLSFYINDSYAQQTYQKCHTVLSANKKCEVKKTDNDSTKVKSTNKIFNSMASNESKGKKAESSLDEMIKALKDHKKEKENSNKKVIIKKK